MQYKFTPVPGAVTTVSNLYQLSGDNFIDDNSVTLIMALFKELYSRGRANLFILLLVVDGWRRDVESLRDMGVNWDWEIDMMHSGKVEKIFTIIFLEGNHWGVF